MNINPNIKDKPYDPMALFLSPWKKPDEVGLLRKLIRNGLMPWEQLLFQANINLCTPLWFVCLKKDGLLDLLPDELHQYLHALFETNKDRNKAFRYALLELHKKLTENNTPFILLKGGGALCENLYDDLGARLLQDLDILVKPGMERQVLGILTKINYEEILNPGREFEGIPTDSRHQHLNTLRKPKTPVVIEIHYMTGYAMVGEFIPQKKVWENTIQILFLNARIEVLNPTWRLIHNVVHGLILKADFIKGTISLQQLSEVAFIVKKYHLQILWHNWLKENSDKRIITQFLSYLALA